MHFTEQPEAGFEMPTCTRFAPSPTGYLHIGGVRTAIFNWLFARNTGGQFILRIDDTDRSRHQEETLRPILDGFRWLGLDWDQGPEVGGAHGPYFQSQRLDKYRAAADQLVAAGAAYPCFCTAEELAAQREEAKRTGAPFQGYSGKCRRLGERQRRDLLDQGRPHVIRFAVPEQGTLEMHDLILGSVSKDSADIGDFVILRADLTPLYNLASVVDDADMCITHVIRAQEHLSNTWPQRLLFEALGRQPPEFAHVPYVAAPGSKEKMSKRKLEQYQTDENRTLFRQLGWPEKEIPNPVMLSFYEELGYLPDAVLNGLARIGWSLDDKQEKISRDELIRCFSLDRVSSAPASFDPQKLLWLQGEYMRELDLARRADGVVPHLAKAGLITQPVTADLRQKIVQVVEVIGDRLKVFSDIIPVAGFLFRTELVYDPKAVKKTLLKDQVPEILSRLEQLIADCDPFTVVELENRVRQMADELGMGAAKLIHPLRVATSGQSIGPGVFEIVQLLGREEALKRIEHTRQRLVAGELE